MFSTRDMSLFSQLGTLAVPAIGLLSLVAMVMVRFLRRGSARFWAAPAQVALCLLPGAVGVALTLLSFRRTMSDTALVVGHGVAAVAAGSAEALMPLLAGTLVVALLASCGLLATGIGSARVAPNGSGRAGVGWGLQAAALAALLLTSALAGFVVRMIAGFNQDPRGGLGLRSRLDTSVAVAAVLALSLLVIVLLTLLGAPRVASTMAVKLGSLSAMSLCGALALTGLYATYRTSDCLTSTALTGLPCDAMPLPAQAAAIASSSEPSEGPLPPPPPPPRRTPPSPRAIEPRYVDPLGAVRVGGAIKQPRKLKNVSPTYPEIARQARVQGVVILECTIDPRGEVVHVKVLRGIPLLDVAAVDAVKQWVYEPTLVDGVAVTVIMTATVNFRLG